MSDDDPPDDDGKIVSLDEAKRRLESERNVNQVDDNDEAAAIEIARLASLSAVAYERERQNAAKRLGLRAKVLDALIRGSQTKSGADNNLQGKALALPDIEPWNDPIIDGAALLTEMVEAIRQYVVVTEVQALAVALWVCHAHAIDAAAHTPRLHVASPDKRCGKSKLLAVIALMVPRALATENITTAALFRSVELVHPCLLVDEADTFLPRNDEMRGILNAGFERGGRVIRSVGDDHEPRAFEVFGPAVISGIGKIPATIEDRSIRINMKRKLRAEMVERLNTKLKREPLRILGRKAARFVADNIHSLMAAEPDLPSSIDDRAQDKWRLPMAIASLCGEDWGKAAWQAAIELSGKADEGNERASAKALADIREIYETRKASQLSGAEDRIASAALVEALINLEGRGWGEYRRGRPLTQNSLSDLLDNYGIKTGSIRVENRSVRGFYWAQFEDDWRRYLHA